MAPHRIFYYTATGKIIICRRMSESNLAERLAYHTDQSYINGYVANPNTHRINLETNELELIPVTVNHYEWFRQRRNLMLTGSDWTQGADSPLSESKKAEWQTYRQALRDLPESVSDPLTSKDSVTWPTKPE